MIRLISITNNLKITSMLLSTVALFMLGCNGGGEGDAQVRLLHAALDSAQLTLQEADEEEPLQVARFASPTNYISISGGDKLFSITSRDNSSNAHTLATTLESGKHYSFLVFGVSGAQATLLPDDLEELRDDHCAIRIINGLSGISTIWAKVSSIELADELPLGAASDYLLQPAGTFQLDVGSGTTDLLTRRYPCAAGTFYSILITGEKNYFTTSTLYQKSTE